MLEYASSPLLPSLTMSPISSPDIVLFNQRPEESKAAQYLIYQPYTLQVIQLVEGPPPPPRKALVSALDSRTSSFASSSCSSEDDESLVSSYCSSDEGNLEHLEPVDSPSLGQTTGLTTPSPDSSESASYNFRMQRILAWRKDFSSSVSATTASSSSHSAPADSHGSSSSSLKRRINDEEHPAGRGNGSSGSKRARSHGQFGPSNSVEHTCTACDLRFPTPQSLRRHGSHDQVATEACFIAVQYAFEQTDDHCERR